MDMSENRKPGDYILDRYLGGAEPEMREEARENLRRLARLIIRVHLRLACENPQAAIREKTEPAVDSESQSSNV
jgi:hypothetical protein